MKANREDGAVDLDSSASLELDRHMIVQEPAWSPGDVDVSRRDTDRHHCDTNQRELLQQPFHGSEFDSWYRDQPETAD